MGLNEFAGYGAVALAALASGYLASIYGLRPENFCSSDSEQRLSIPPCWLPSATWSILRGERQPWVCIASGAISCMHRCVIVRGGG